MKRVLICLLMLLLVLSLPAAASAAGNQTVFGQKVEGPVSAGDTFTYEVALKGNTGMVVGAVSVSWPVQDLKLNSVKIGSVMPDNGTAPISSTNRGRFTVTFGSDTAKKNYTEDGVLFTMTFEVLETATAGKKELTLSYGRSAEDFLDFDLNTVPTDFESGYVNVKGHVHNLVKTPAKDPTETEPGNAAYWTCSGCGLYFSDAEGLYPVEKDSWIIPAQGTTPTDPTDPDNPADPTNPDNPADPTNPDNPADPSNPTDPTNPDNPADPSNPDPGQQSGMDSFFEDVKQTDYFYNPVKWAVEKGVTSGVSKTLFGPAQNCTRGQVVTFLWIVNGKQEIAKAAPFTDVPADAYFAKAVSWAVEQGITAGLSEKEFGPAKTVTRAQFVTMLWVAKGMPSADAASNFTDVPANAYYAKAVAWAFANDITAGKSPTAFAPDDPCTRGQIVTFLYNSYK